MDIRRRKKAEIVIDLTKLEFPLLKDSGYDYLLDMPLYSLTLEKIEKMEADIVNLQRQLTELINITEIQLWKTEVLNIKKKLEEYSTVWENKYIFGGTKEDSVGATKKKAITRRIKD